MLLALLAAPQAAPPADLMRFARPIASLARADLTPWSIGWQWAGPGRVVYEARHTNGRPNLVLRDLRTGKEKNLTGLNRAIGFHKHGQFEVSPDGRRVMWHDEEDGMRLATLEGGQLQRLPGAWHLSSFAWIDSRHYAVVEGSLQDDAAFTIRIGRFGSRMPLRLQKRLVRTNQRPLASNIAPASLDELLSTNLRAITFSTERKGIPQRDFDPSEFWVEDRDLWLKPSNGTLSHRVGRLPAIPVGDDYALQWIPGEDAVSFGIGQILYRLDFSPGAHGTTAPVPTWARPFGVSLVAKSEATLERRLGPARHITGGHSNSGRLWRLEGGLEVASDGFTPYPEDYAFEGISLEGWRGELGQHPAAKRHGIAPYGKLRIGMSVLDALEVLPRDLPNLKVEPNQIQWSTQTRPPLPAIRTLAYFEGTLLFNKHGLTELRLQGDYEEERQQTPSSSSQPNSPTKPKTP